jgi:hypothetical protein
MAVVYTNTGKAWVPEKMTGTKTTSQNRIGWGTGAGTSAVANTTLFTEASETRSNGVMTEQTTTVTGDTYQVVGTLTAAGSKTITNAGVFDAASGGDMLLKGDHAGVPLLANDSIEYTFQLQQT